MKKAVTKESRVTTPVAKKAVRSKMSAKAMTMNFGEAIAKAKMGAKIARKGWKGMFVIFVPGQKVTLIPDSPYAKALGRRKSVVIDAHFDMFTANKTMQPGWLASQADMQATDWVQVK